MNNQKSNSDQIPDSFTTLNLLQQQSQLNHPHPTRPQPIPRSQSNLNLDQTSKAHLYSLIHQSIENVGSISNLNHHQKRKIKHQFNSTSNHHFFWANELFRIIESDVLDCFTDQILTELQHTKLNLSKSLQEFNQKHLSSNLRKLKSNPNSPHPLSHTRSGLFTTRVKDQKDSYPALQTPDLSRSKSPDAFLATQTRQDRPNLSPSLFVTAFQTASPPELWLPEHSLSMKQSKPELTSRSSLIETLKARTSELIIDSHPDRAISEFCTSPNLDSLIEESDVVELTVRAVKFHYKRIKTKPLDNQREASFEPNKWCTIPTPVQDHSTQASNLPEASTSKATRPRIVDQADVVELFSDSSCKMSDLLGGDSSDSLEPLMVTLRDGRIARVRTELIGGTITLKGPGRELRKFKKVVELAIFAACNMKLEVHVRRDAFCSRPVFLSSQQCEEPHSMVLGADEELSTLPPHLDDLEIPPDTPHIAFAQDTPPQSKIKFNQPHSPSHLFGPPSKPLLPHSISSQYSIITADSNWLSPPPPAVASSTSLPLSPSETLTTDASPSTLVSPGPSLDYATPPQSPQSYRDPLNSTSPTFQRSSLNSSSASIPGRAKWSKAGLWSMLLGKPAQSYAHPQFFVQSASPALDQPRYNHHVLMSEPSEHDGIISGDEADTDEDPKSVTPEQTTSPTPKKSIASSQTPSSSCSPKSSPVTQSSPTARKRFAQRIKKRLETSPNKYHRAPKEMSIMPGSFFYNTYGRGSGFGRRGYAESDEWELVAGFGHSPSGRTRRDSADDGDTTDAGGHGGDESCSIDSIDNQLEKSTENRAPSPDTTSESSDKPRSRTFVTRLSNTFLHFKAARSASQKVHRPPTKIAEVTDEASLPASSIETQFPTSQETEDEVQGDQSEKEPELASAINQPIVGRFERVIEKMNRAILSVSPDVVFPPPHLLVRLRQQEIAEISLFTSTTDMLPQPSNFANSSGARSPLITPASDGISSSTITSPKLADLNPTRPIPLDRQRSFATADAECLSNRFADANSLPNSAESTPVRIQKASQPLPQSPRSVSSASNAPTSQPAQGAQVVEPRETAPDASHPHPLLSQSPRPRKPLEQRKIAVDARAGLASLMTNNSSLDGTLRHQSIQFLCEKSSLFSSPGTTACESPTWKTWKYYQDFCLNPRALDLLKRKDKTENTAALPLKETGFNVGSLMGLGAAAELSSNQTSNEPVLDTRGLQYKLTGTVGQVVSKLVDERDQLCVQESGIAGKCGGKRMGDHVISLIHNTVRIIVSVEDQLAVAKATPSSLYDEDLKGDHKGLKRSTSDGGMVDVQNLPLRYQEGLCDHEIVMWMKCRICGRCTKPVVCSEATLLFSFAKYLELILYDGNFVPAPEDLCDHGTERQDALIRFFSKGKARVKLALETVDLFELRLPTAIDQSIRDDGIQTGRPTFDPHQYDSIRQLEDEITGFFGSLYTRTSMIDDLLFRRDQRLDLVQQRVNPSTLDEDSETNRATPTVNKESTTSVITEEEKIEKTLAGGGISRGRSHTIKAAVTDHRAQLQNLIKAFEKEESDLRSNLPDLDPSNLNSLRKPFFDTIVRSKARLMTWEKKHLSTLTGPDGRQKLGEASFLEPIYSQPGIHALPADTSIIIRETEISSIIAFTLSSSDYKTLLSSISNPKRPSTSGSSSNHSRSSSNVFGTPIPSPPVLNGNVSKRDFSLPIALLSSTEELPDVPLGSKASPLGSPRMKSTQNNGNNNNLYQKTNSNDPDDDQATFGKECSFEGRAKLKKPYKQPTGILSLRSLSKQKSFDVGSFRPFGSVGSRLNTPAAKNMTQDPMTMFDDNASLSMMNEGGDDKILDDLITSSQTSTISSSATAKPNSVAPGPVAALLSRGAKAEVSTVSISHADTMGDLSVMVKSRASSIKSKVSIEDLEKVMEHQTTSMNEVFRGNENDMETLSSEENDSETQQTPPASRMLSKAQPSQHRPVHSSILSAPLQAIWTLGGSIKMKQGGGTATGSTNAGGIDPKEFDGTDPDSNPNTSPHIKYKFKHGTKEFSCTIWHASQFKEIRQRCGVSEEFLIESLSRCNTWNTTGGKSSSNFFITNDQRFILKGMITNWNKSEREGLLSFAPNYFKYLSNQTLIKPSLICKIFGFFTVKIKEKVIGSNKNETNLIKLDLLLMENLFYGQTITRKFDLKGITSRVAKVKKDEKDSGTGWDADWIEGSLRTLLLIHPHSKHVISNAIENDTKFLSESNVMDYSLLVGVDDLRKELVVGMIDVIGTFNLAKMLESRGKMVLKSSDKKGEVTILPPIEYANRFKKAMETYFVAVPEKWSRPLEKESQTIQDHQEDPSLSSVF